MPFVMIGDWLLDCVGPVQYFVFIFLVDMLFCIVAYQRRSLTFSGTLATMVVGVSTFFFLGLPGWMCLIVFFVSSTGLGKLARSGRQRTDIGIQKKGGCRDYMQVFANGGPAAAAAVLYGMTGNPLFIVLFGVGIAASNSDTWAGEIGIMSPKPPVMITTFKPVEPGLSGGVTRLGTGGAFAGSVTIAVTWYVGFHGLFAAKWFKEACIIAVSGFLGSMTDSILGATVQGHYWDQVRGRLTEHDVSGGQRNELYRGWSFMDNDMVNLTSNLVSIAAAVGMMFRWIYVE